MAALNSTSVAIMLLALASRGSTCHGQSGGSDVSKDPAPTTDVNLAGVDTSPLTPREKKDWSGYVSELLAPCSDVPVSVAQCVSEKRACSRCLPAAKFILKGVRDGMSREQIEKSYHGRFDADRIKNVAVLDSPAKGPANAPITLIEFADFECPFCAMMAPRLEDTWGKRSQQVRFVFKFMPLGGHPHGEIAARAAIAALDQGKFWEMHDKLFANRDHLEQPDLESYAKDLGLDLNKFRQDMNAQSTTDRIANDRKQADSLDVKGTPTIYINGREYDPQSDLDEWLNLELGGGGGSPAGLLPGGTKAAANAPGPAADAAAKPPSPAPAPTPSGAKK